MYIIQTATQKEKKDYQLSYLIDMFSFLVYFKEIQTWVKVLKAYAYTE